MACLTFNYAAESMIRCGHAHSITTSEAMRILQECKEAGLVQTGDNVQRNVSYICNCCGCCCGMIDAIKRFDLRHAIVTRIGSERLTFQVQGMWQVREGVPRRSHRDRRGGRGKAEEKVGDLRGFAVFGLRSMLSGLQVCGIVMKPRAKRVFTPETAFDRIVSMAIERGKLANIIFDDPEKLSYRALGRVVNILEKSPPFRAAMAIEPLRSNFLRTVVKAAKKSSGALAKEMC